jgi:hypothetical protein
MKLIKDQMPGHKDLIPTLLLQEKELEEGTLKRNLRIYLPDFLPLGGDRGGLAFKPLSLQHKYPAILF